MLLISLATALAACDGAGPDPRLDVPPDRLIAAVALYNVGDGRPDQRLVLLDADDPARYEIIGAAGTWADRPCFDPAKERILYVDYEVAYAGGGGRLRLVDLEDRSVRTLDAMSRLEGCVWAPDGSGVYYAEAGAAGVTGLTHYNLDTGEKRQLGQSQTGATVIPYGRKGRDSILVLSNDPAVAGEDQIPGFYFVDGATGEYLQPLQNPHIQFISDGEESRNYKQGAYQPAYREATDQVAFLVGGSTIEPGIVISDLAGRNTTTFSEDKHQFLSSPLWGRGQTLLLSRRAYRDGADQEIVSLDVQTGTVTVIVKAEKIGGAIGLRMPDY